MMFHGGWWTYLSSEEAKPRVTWGLLKRALSYGWRFRWHIAMLVMILITTGLTLITPIILRDLIDHAIPTGDVNRLVLLAFGLLLIPAGRLDQRLPAAAERLRRRGRDLRLAPGAVCASAAHVAALLHPYQGGRIDEPPE